jgi:pimeloyl-ACP methyl ester carboxylesterase
MSRRNLFNTVLALTLSSLTPVGAFAQSFTSDRITVTTVGQGSDVILIPGLDFSPRVWAELVKAVPGHRYHLVQISGFAGQPIGGNKEGPVAAPVAEEIARYIAAAKLTKPAVIGHSMGGSIGIMLAARHPNAISKLMVVDIPPFVGALFGPIGTTSESIKQAADAIVAPMRTTDPAARQQQVEMAVTGMINNTAMRPIASEDLLKSDPDVSARAFREVIVTDLGPELSKIIVPTTVLYVTPKGGQATDAQIDAFYKAAYAPLTGAVVKRIPESAHVIMWDQPGRFQSEVIGFLR